MFITQKALSRRTVLKGMGVTLALPMLEAMVPVRSAFGATASGKKIRLVAVEMVHGAAGSSQYGLKKNLWSPAGTGRGTTTASARAGGTGRRTAPSRRRRIPLAADASQRA